LSIAMMIVEYPFNVFRGLAVGVASEVTSKALLSDIGDTVCSAIRGPGIDVFVIALGEPLLVACSVSSLAGKLSRCIERCRYPVLLQPPRCSKIISPLAAVTSGAIVRLLRGNRNSNLRQRLDSSIPCDTIATVCSSAAESESNSGSRC
jgi:hypothetical protein